MAHHILNGLLLHFAQGNAVPRQMLLITLLALICFAERTEGKFKPSYIRKSEKQLDARVDLLFDKMLPQERLSVAQCIEKIEAIELKHDTTDNLWGAQEIHKGHDSLPIIICIQGLPASKKSRRVQEWVEVFYNLYPYDYTCYFQKISRRLRLHENSQTLLANLLTIRHNNPHREIVVMAHCTGGAVLLAGLGELSEADSLVIKQLATLQYHIIGAPMNDYNAPNSVKMIQGLFPRTRLVLDLGRVGLTNTVIPPGITGTQYVNHFTMDHTNMNVSGHYPQLRCSEKQKSYDKALETMYMPLGNENTVFLYDDSHFSMLGTIFEKELNVENRARTINGHLIQPLREN